MKSNCEMSDHEEFCAAETFEKVIEIILQSDSIPLKEITDLSMCYKKLTQQLNLIGDENKRLKAELVNIVRSLNLASRIDNMTGLANRRDIMEKIGREATRSKRHQKSFVILLVNIDNFKKINDTHGYNTGDDVLVEIARELEGCVRNEDICARWGGDEFLILLPETRSENSQPVALKVLESVSMTVFKAHKPGIHITVSIGICEHDPSQTAQECISRANQALLYAKKNGKNRYIIAT